MSNRVVVVTGAASGIGFATAERFRDLGDTVFALDIATSVPDGVTFVKCDLGDREAVEAAVATCAEAGRIDVVANVAGIVQFGRFETVTEEVFDRVMAVDVKGPFFLVQAALPHLRASRGCVVNVSSVAGRIPQPYSAAYSAAKGALTQLTRALALELSTDGIRVNAVCPGTVDTPLVAKVAETYPADLDPRVSDRLLAMLPGAASSPDEIASTIVYLASADARMMTGAIVAHDGGMG